MNLMGKVAIVTGASMGIGEATAQLFTRGGAKVALVARSRDKLAKLEKELPGSVAFFADMTNEKNIREMIGHVFAHYGRIDILVNNAGQGYDSRLEDLNLKTFRHIIDLDVIGPVIAMQQVIPVMRKLGGGSIVNVSSGSALMYLAGMGPYSSAKRMLSALSLTARDELKDEHITVSVVYPYITATEFETHTIVDGEPFRGSETTGPPRDLPQPDSAGYAAGLILQAVETGKTEVFAHEWMLGGRK